MSYDNLTRNDITCGDQSTIEIGGTLVPPAAGNLSLDPTSRMVTFTPATGGVPDSLDSANFTYRLVFTWRKNANETISTKSVAAPVVLTFESEKGSCLCVIKATCLLLSPLVKSTLFLKS